MFRGVHYLTIDDKGRFAMPAKYRDEILESCGGHLVITVSTDKCLLVYPKPVWEEKQEEIMDMPNINPSVRWLQRMVIGHASDTEMSKQGRILLAPSLREFVGLEKEVALVGLTEKFELWNAGTWKASCDEWPEEAGQIDFDSEAFKGFSL